MDIIGATAGLILLSPLFLVIAIVIRRQIGPPVLFRQVRPGLKGEPFQMVKFRTMLNAYGPDGEALPDHQRLTRFGRLLRSTSLDELPELWNVLRGDMSCVGPRPTVIRGRYGVYQIGDV